jgi:hypothetical protein
MDRIIQIDALHSFIAPYLTMNSLFRQTGHANIVTAACRIYFSIRSDTVSERIFTAVIHK